MPDPAAPKSSHIMRGILLRIGAAITFALMAGLLKLASTRGAGIGEIYFYRALFGLIVVLIWILPRQGISVLATRRPMAHATRSAIGLTAMFCTFEALILLPLAEATTINFTGPIFATFLSWLILDERVGRHRWLAAMVAFAGVIVVMRPGADAHEIAPLGVAIGLAAAFGQASVTVTLRHLGASENVAAIVFWFHIACTSVGLLLITLLGTDPDVGTILILIAGGTVGGIAQIFMTASLQAAPVAVLTPFDYLQLIVAVAFGWLLLASEPTINTFAGALLIAGSGLYTAWREQRRQHVREIPPTQPLA